MVQFSDGRRIQLHCADARELPLFVGRGSDLAVMDFSVSQIIRSKSDIRKVLSILCVDHQIPRICIIAHDHVHAGLPSLHCGVTIRVTEPAQCLGSGDIGWCRCPSGEHHSTRLETTVNGSSMAVGICEYAFDAAAFVFEVRRLTACGILPRHLTIRARRPFSTESGNHRDVHWLLRSLTLVRIECAN